MLDIAKARISLSVLQKQKIDSKYIDIWKKEIKNRSKDTVFLSIISFISKIISDTIDDAYLTEIIDAITSNLDIELSNEEKELVVLLLMDRHILKSKSSINDAEESIRLLDSESDLIRYIVMSISSTLLNHYVRTPIEYADKIRVLIDKIEPYADWYSNYFIKK